MKVSILGEPYSFHHVAAMQYWDTTPEFQFYSDFDAMIGSVQLDQSDFCLIAVENTIAGDVPGNYARVANSQLHTNGEIYLHLDMHLAAKSQVSIDALHTVISHPMALKETSRFFDAWPHIRLVPTNSTSTAVKTVSESSDPGLGAIANLAAIRFFNLQILAKNVDDLPNNTTKFLILSKGDLSKDATFTRAKASVHIPAGATYPKEELMNVRLFEDGSQYAEIGERDKESLIHITQLLESAGVRLLGMYAVGAAVSGS